MGRKKWKPPRHELIVAANLDLLIILGVVGRVDGTVIALTPGELDLAERTCWACRNTHPTLGMVRAHVTAVSKGGDDRPGNFFLLCDVCHDDQPDGLPRDDQLRWLAAREHHEVRIARFASHLVDEMTRLAGGGREGKAAVHRYSKAHGHEVAGIIHRGYDAAAGWKNGRANAAYLLLVHFTAWLHGQSHQ